MRKLASIVITFSGLLAIALATSLLGYALVNVQSLQSPEDGMLWLVIFGFVPPTLSALFGMYLIYNRDYWASRLFADEEVERVIDPVGLLVVGLTLIGVSMLLHGFAELISDVVFMSVQSGGGDLAYRLPTVVGPSIRIAFGLILVVRSRALAGLLFNVPSAVEDSEPSAACPSCGEPYDVDDYASGVVARCSGCGGELDFASNKRIEPTA